MEEIENICEIMQASVNEMATKIAKEKERLIKERISQLTDEDIDLIAECKKRFPRIVRELNNDEETFYWNDGYDGIRLITFYSTQPNFDFSDAFKSSFNIELKYM